MPNCLCDVFIYIRDAPATYPDNGIASLSGRALSKTGPARKFSGRACVWFGRA